MKYLIVGLLVLTTSCSNKQPKPKEVSIPVSVACLKERPIMPVLNFDILPPAKDETEVANQVRVLWQDRQALKKHATDWDTAAAGCQVIKQ